MQSETTPQEQAQRRPAAPGDSSSARAAATTSYDRSTLLRRARLHPWHLWVGAGLLSAIVSSININGPSFWADEAATISAIQRPLGDLFGLLGTIDAVHGLYYFLMHFWAAIFGTTEAALRIPSALGLVVANVALVRYLATTHSHLLAAVTGVVFAFLPGLTWAGNEGRSSSFVVTCSVITTVQLLRWAQFGGRRKLLPYLVFSVLGIYFNLMFVFLLISHLAMAVLWKAHTRRLVATTLAASLILALPLILVGISQQKQVNWLDEYSDEQIRDMVLHSQFFRGPELDAWILLALCTVLIVMGACGPYRRMALTGVLWFVIPLATFMILHLLGKHLYLPRYAIYTDPGFSLAVGCGIATFRRWSFKIVAAVSLVVTLACVPAVASQKDHLAHAGQDYRTLSEMVQNSQTVIYEDAEARGISIAYPRKTRNVEDLALEQTPEESDTLFGINTSVEKLNRRAKEVKGWVTVITPFNQPHSGQAMKDHCQITYSDRFGQWNVRQEVCQ